MKKLSVAVIALIMLSCTSTQRVFKRDGVLVYDGKHYKFEPIGQWREYRPDRQRDTLFQYVIKR